LSKLLRYCLCFFLLCIIKHDTFGQYESANWIFTEYTLSFISENPTATNPVLSNYSDALASYSTDKGELLISTDGSTVWNGNGEIMRNGENITPYRTKSVIIPKPGTTSQYYIFSYNAFNVPGNNNNTLSVIVYAIVDVKASNNQGEVLEKNKVLYNNMHGTFTISGNCDRSVFWLVGDVDTNLIEGSDKIYIFQIDKNGIMGPYTSKPLPIGNGSSFRLSPDARKFLFSVDGIPFGLSETYVADFKPEILPADVIVNKKEIPGFGPGEFSSNSRFVYLIDRSKRLIQYDIETEETTELFSGTEFLGAPQLAANGKIYIPVGDQKRMMVINKPDLAGLSCDFSESGISIPVESFVLPAFASNIFYKGSYPANAGADQAVCGSERVKIGSAENRATVFSWEPATWLEDPDSLQPVFQYTGPDDGTDSFTYKLTTYFEGCTHTDMVVVKLNSSPATPVIDGSRSVCPGVNGVEYKTGKKKDFKYNWNVTGGTIDGRSGLDSILVNWGATNQNASVELQVFGPNECSSDVATLKVLISTELQTETPQGLDSVCVNLIDQNRYKITNTSGSTYTWDVLNGEIVKGDGTNTVFVNWNTSNTGKIWVKEKSATSQAVCYGNSDTLNIAVFKDPAIVNLDYITVDDSDEKVIHLQASTAYANRINELRVLARQEGAGLWEEIGVIQAAPVMQISKGNFLTDDYSYQFQLSYLNKCEEWSSGNIHKSIRLTAREDEENNLIDLGWSAYNFWSEGAVRYEVWWSFTDARQYQQEGTKITDTLASIHAAESFSYFLKVMALRSDGVFTSRSNEVKVEFERELFVPNVITPNQDGFNDTFEIKNIELYPVNRLIIFNRYGKVLKDQSGYQGGWNGNDVSAGIYYYTLLLPEKQKEYKGWLQVIR